jgi:hypothetical protein
MNRHPSELALGSFGIANSKVDFDLLNAWFAGNLLFAILKEPKATESSIVPGLPVPPGCVPGLENRGCGRLLAIGLRFRS